MISYKKQKSQEYTLQRFPYKNSNQDWNVKFMRIEKPSKDSLRSLSFFTQATLLQGAIVA